jgi:hypothetical protein
MSPRILPIEEGQALTHHFSTYVDVTMVNSALAALLVLVGAVWGLYLMHRLWQTSLAEESAGALDAAAALGLVVHPPGFTPRLVATGDLGGQPVRVEWRGGVLGARTRVRVGGYRQTLPLVTDAEGLAAALDR